MSRLIESIKVENQTFQNLDWHQKRVDEARSSLFGYKDILQLSEMLKMPSNIDDSTYKCRIIYNKNIRKIEFLPYVNRKIQSLKIIFEDDINYSHKFEDRKKINELYAQKGDCDDILIIKKGYITDTSYCNIIFFDEKKWITPNTALLKGTKRAKLLSEKKIKESPVYWDEIKCYKKASLINAFLDVDNNFTTFPILNIKE